MPAGFFGVSVRGDDEYRRLLRIVAAKRGQTMADVMRAALDRELESEPEAASFFAKSEKHTSHSKSRKAKAS
jgi:plasmid stability protein